MNLRLNNSGRVVFFCTILQFLGTIDIIQDVGFTAGKDSPGNAEGIESMVFVFVVVVSVVIVCNCGFASSYSTSSPLSLELMIGCRSRNCFFFRKVFSIFSCSPVNFELKLLISLPPLVKLETAPTIFRFLRLSVGSHYVCDFHWLN